MTRFLFIYLFFRRGRVQEEARREAEASLQKQQLAKQAAAMAKFEEDQVRRAFPWIHLLRRIPPWFSRQLCFFHGIFLPSRHFHVSTGFLPVFPGEYLRFSTGFLISQNSQFWQRFLPVF